MDRLDALGVDPLAGLAAIAKDEAAPLELRAKIQSDFLRYIYPTRKAIEVDTGQRPSVNISIGIPQKPKAAQPPHALAN